MIDEYLVGINEYKVLNNDSPVGYVRDLTSCVGVLVHKGHETLISHIEAYESGRIRSDVFENLLDEDTVMVELFKASLTEEENIKKLTDILHEHELSYVIKDVFYDHSNQTSVGYNYSKDEYLVVSMDKGRPIFSNYSHRAL